MHVAVRYYSKTGNTKKLAEAIALAVGTEPHSVEVPLPKEPLDLLFLGSSVYGGGVAQEIKDFIHALHPEQVTRVVNFSTSALVASTHSQVTKLLLHKGIPMDPRQFYCRGKFKFLHTSRPNQEDIVNAQQFAQDIVT